MKDLMDMMKKARQMQEAMARVREEIASLTVEGSAGKGAVKVVLTGTMEAVKVSIDPSAVDPAHPGTLEDLVRAAINDAAGKARKAMKAGVARVAGGLPIPPGLF